MKTTLQADTVAELGIIADEIICQALLLPRTGAAVVTLTGDLGAGKTTLTKAIAVALGITQTVSSPTFVVMKQYSTDSDLFAQLVHMDAYRIGEDQELAPLHFDDITADKGNLLVIEWPSLIEASLPACHLAVSITEEGGGRLFTLEPHHG